MKRSEIINELCYFLDTEYDLAHPDKARLIISKLEELGMQPPAVKEPCETFVVHNGRYIQTDNSFIFTHKWDEE